MGGGGKGRGRRLLNMGESNQVVSAIIGTRKANSRIHNSAIIFKVLSQFPFYNNNYVT